MRVVTFYDPTTGEILSSIRGPESDIAANRPTGSAIIDGAYDGRTHRIIDGKPQPRARAPLKLTYVGARLAAYPPIGDFLDAYYWREKGDPAPMRKWIAAVDAVKAEFPKEDKG